MILVTGCAGFIGYFTAARLLAEGHDIVGIDNLNDYYDVSLKEERLGLLKKQPRFRFVQGDVADGDCMQALFDQFRPDQVIHLAAQAGVRYSLKNPVAYAVSNLLGFTHVLEQCRIHGVDHLIYASTSSVYGSNHKLPFSESDPVDHPVSFYAATKKANELMAHSYSHLYGLPTTGLRFFTVYGPMGRPDMSPMLFAKAILEGEPIHIFNDGDMSRDFTYVDDIVEGIVRTLGNIPIASDVEPQHEPDPATSSAPYRVYNIGNHAAVRLMDYISTLEAALGKTTKHVFEPMQPGDVKSTYADTDRLAEAVGFAPSTPLDEGLRRFAAWYREYHARRYQ